LAGSSARDPQPRRRLSFRFAKLAPPRLDRVVDQKQAAWNTRKPPTRYQPSLGTMTTRGRTRRNQGPYAEN